MPGLLLQLVHLTAERVEVLALALAPRVQRSQPSEVLQFPVDDVENVRLVPATPNQNRNAVLTEEMLGVYCSLTLCAKESTLPSLISTMALLTL